MIATKSERHCIRVEDDGQVTFRKCQLLVATVVVGCMVALTWTSMRPFIQTVIPLLYVRIWAHELAHWNAAKNVGLHPSQIDAGEGLMFTIPFRLGNTTLRQGCLPLGGKIYAALDQLSPDDRFYVAIAGPRMDGFLALLLLGAGMLARSYPLYVCAVICIFQMLWNLNSSGESEGDGVVICKARREIQRLQLTNSR